MPDFRAAVMSTEGDHHQEGDPEESQTVEQAGQKPQQTIVDADFGNEEVRGLRVVHTILLSGTPRDWESNPCSVP